MDAKARTSKLVCRLIDAADITAVSRLLHEGFPQRTLAYWKGALDALDRRQAPGDYPRYGYLLQDGGEVVGVILLIFSSAAGSQAETMRCNVSSWFVRPAYRSYGALLISRALRFKHVTYLNVSPAPHTLPILQAQGYRRFSDGVFVCAPALCRPAPSAHSLNATVRRHDPESARALEDPRLCAVLEEPLRPDALIFSAEHSGDVAPFVFVPTRIKALRRGVLQLAYCRDTSDFVRYATPVGRALLRSGFALVTLDAVGRVDGLFGRYFADRHPKYVRGPGAPRLNDLTSTEALLFGG